jgi:hypothetical protein
MNQENLAILHDTSKSKHDKDKCPLAPEMGNLIAYARKGFSNS